MRDGLRGARTTVPAVVSLAGIIDGAVVAAGHFPAERALGRRVEDHRSARFDDDRVTFVDRGVGQWEAAEEDGDFDIGVGRVVDRKGFIDAVGALTVGEPPLIA